MKLWVMKMSDDRYLQSLVESMPRRLQEVIEREVDTTKYQYCLCISVNKDFTLIYLVSYVLNTFILATGHV